MNQQDFSHANNPVFASASLGLRAAALLFCTDNVTLPRNEDRKYRGLKDPRVQRGFDAGLETAIAVLSAPIE